jgi:hypothetical protein
MSAVLDDRAVHGLPDEARGEVRPLRRVDRPTVHTEPWAKVTIVMLKSDELNLISLESGLLSGAHGVRRRTQRLHA